MLSFMIPTEEKSFNLNTTQNDVFQVSNGHGEIKAELSGPTGVTATAPANGSPNNNSHPVLAAAMTSALDNAAPPLPLQPQPPPPAPLTHDLSLMEDSYSDDTATESTLLLRPADDRFDEVMTPSTENTRGSPCGDDKPLLPAATVSGKTGKLKRVSFGSSKGSMVETVVYDYEPVQPLREEDGSESPDPRSTPRNNFITSTPRSNFTTSTPLSTPARSEPSAAERAASRVRVTYFESKRPLLVPAPDPGETPIPEELDVPAPPPDTEQPGHTQVTAAAGEMPTTYIVQTIDAGWENPFRPGGELSKEADQIVRAIQSGRPLDSSLDEADAAADAAVNSANGHLETAPAPPNGGPAGEPIISATVQTAVSAAPPGGARDGPAPGPAAGGGHRNGGSAPAPAAQTAVAAQSPGTVEVQHTLVKPEDASQVEQVTLKKKPRGKCCVVQ